MDEKLLASLKSLRNTTSRLNILSDQANESVKLVEKYLNECNVGGYTSVLVEDSEQGTCYLIYGKVGGSYRIAVIFEDGSNSDSVKPWSDCSREEKMHTIKKLPDLLNAISSKINNEMAQAEEATASISKIIKSIVGKEG